MLNIVCFSCSTSDAIIILPAKGLPTRVITKFASPADASYALATAAVFINAPIRFLRISEADTISVVTSFTSSSPVPGNEVSHVMLGFLNSRLGEAEIEKSHHTKLLLTARDEAERDKIAEQKLAQKCDALAKRRHEMDQMEMRIAERIELTQAGLNVAAAWKAERPALEQAQKQERRDFYQAWKDEERNQPKFLRDIKVEQRHILKDIEKEKVKRLVLERWLQENP